MSKYKETMYLHRQSLIKFCNVLLFHLEQTIQFVHNFIECLTSELQGKEIEYVMIYLIYDNIFLIYESVTIL